MEDNRLGDVLHIASCNSYYILGVGGNVMNISHQRLDCRLVEMARCGGGGGGVNGLNTVTYECIYPVAYELYV